MTLRTPTAPPPWNELEPHELERARNEVRVRFPPGHFYSPLVDTRLLATPDASARCWPDDIFLNDAIDWRHDEQCALVRDVFAAQERPHWAGAPNGPMPTEYWHPNDSLPVIDAWVLDAMLRHLRPRRIVEVGSGMSTLVMLQTNREHLGGSAHISVIEPYPDEHTVSIEGVHEVRRELVQDTPLDVFDALGDGDVLFVDSSHVLKTGSDLQWILSRVLPRLAPGVCVHFHDIFLPSDYPRRWALQGWGWNEQYALEAFLAFNHEFSVLLGVQYMLLFGDGVMESAFEVPPQRGGGSFWIRRTNG